MARGSTPIPAPMPSSDGSETGQPKKAGGAPMDATRLNSRPGSLIIGCALSGARTRSRRSKKCEITGICIAPRWQEEVQAWAIWFYEGTYRDVVYLPEFTDAVLVRSYLGWKPGFGLWIAVRATVLQMVIAQGRCLLYRFMLGRDHG